MDAIERDDLRMWWLFRLADAWDSSSSDVEQVDEDRYVQWAGYGLGLQIECVSNHFLTGAARLAPAQMERLRDDGWQDPLGNDLPNFWRSFIDRDDLPVAADALMAAVDILRGRTPAG